MAIKGTDLVLHAACFQTILTQFDFHDCTQVQMESPSSQEKR